MCRVTVLHVPSDCITCASTVLHVPKAGVRGGDGHDAASVGRPLRGAQPLHQVPKSNAIGLLKWPSKGVLTSPDVDFEPNGSNVRRIT